MILPTWELDGTTLCDSWTDWQYHHEDEHLEILEYFFTVVETNLPNEAERRQFLDTFLVFPRNLRYLNAKALRCITKHVNISVETFLYDGEAVRPWPSKIRTCFMHVCKRDDSPLFEEDLDALEFILTIHPSSLNNIFAWDEFSELLEHAPEEHRDSVLRLLASFIEQCPSIEFPACLIPYLQEQEMEHALDMRELGEFVGLVGYILQQESELIFRRNHV